MTLLKLLKSAKHYATLLRVVQLGSCTYDLRSKGAAAIKTCSQVHPSPGFLALS